MGFLRRLLGGSATLTPKWPPPGPIADWPVGDLKGDLSVAGVMFEAARRMVDVVGESSYQGSIERVAGGRTIDGARLRDHSALLMPEPTNPYDV